MIEGNSSKQLTPTLQSLGTRGPTSMIPVRVKKRAYMRLQTPILPRISQAHSNEVRSVPVDLHVRGELTKAMGVGNAGVSRELAVRKGRSGIRTSRRLSGFC